MEAWHWCLPVAAVNGLRTRGWLAPALLGSLHPRSRCPPMGASSSSAHLMTMAASARHGYSRAAEVTGRRTSIWLGAALRRPYHQRLSTVASTWSAGLMTTAAQARQRCSPREVVAPILKSSRDHLLHLILRGVSRNDPSLCSRSPPGFT